MLRLRLGVVGLALLLSACATQSGGGLLTASTETFQNDKVTITVNLINSLSGCFPTGGTIQNKQNTALGYVYAQMFASTQDGRTVGTWSVNFPPTVGGGSAQAATVTGGGGAGAQCQTLQFHINP